ncbi:MAG: MMPL family transporter, partial [Propionibacteriaceae bacterium]|nr:MMPL family transporter [Propionibacteriaceae bacterium]
MAHAPGPAPLRASARPPAMEEVRLSSALYLLGTWVVRVRRWVIAAWGLFIAAVAVAAIVFSAGLDAQIVIPGLEASDALESLGRTFPQASGASAQVLVAAPDGAVAAGPAYEEPVAAAVAALEDIGQVMYVASPFADGASGAVSDDGRAVLITAQVSYAPDGYITDATKQALQAATDALAAQLPAGAEADLGGGVFSYTLPTVTLTEVFGVVAALVVLILNFGSLLTAGMPVLVALAGVAVSMSCIYLGTAWASINSTTPILSLMLGLAVGIDYSLFIISRHRQQAVRGLPAAESIPRALATAGSAVVFAGLTVIVALLGLSVARIPFLTVMGVAAALAVACAVLAALTLLPAVLAAVGDRVLPRAARRRLAADQPADNGAVAPAATPPPAAAPDPAPVRPVAAQPVQSAAPAVGAAAPTGRAVDEARILLGLAAVTAADGSAAPAASISASLPAAPAPPPPGVAVRPESAV